MNNNYTYTHLSDWQKYQGAILWQGLPYETDTPSPHEAQKAVQANHALFARWTSDFDCGKSEWWYCICDKFTKLEDLTAKQRYRVRKGLANCTVKVCRQLSEDQTMAIYQLMVDSFADYPAAYRPTMNSDSTKLWLHELLQDPNTDIWLGHDNQQNLIAFGYCQREKDIVWLRQVKVPTKYLATEVNAALAYSFCEYYLNDGSCRFICDGERNIKHQTSYQEFLVRVLNFRYAYCRLNIVYAWWMKLVVDVLYPIRNVLRKLGENNATVYNIYCVLNQENIRRSFT